MKRKFFLLLGAVLMATSLTSCYTDPFYWGGSASVGTYRPAYGYSRGYSSYYRPSPRSYGYPSRSYSHHPHHGGYSSRGPGRHHHHHH